MRIEVDHVDGGRRLGKIGEHVAAAGADRDDAMMRLEFHGLHVEVRIFPDLRVDEAGKEQPEKSLGKALLGKCLVAEKSGLKFPVLAEAGIRCKFRHVSLSPF